MLEVVRWLVFAFGAYLALGLAFAVVFSVRGVHRTDPAAEGSGWGFRLLIVPGSALFWPVLWIRWSQSPHRTDGRVVQPHRSPPSLADLPTDDGTIAPTATNKHTDDPTDGGPGPETAR
ncbi:MAG: hypothetical protein AAF297_11165 [Planctomycetota bacterium]